MRFPSFLFAPQLPHETFFCIETSLHPEAVIDMSGFRVSNGRMKSRNGVRCCGMRQTACSSKRNTTGNDEKSTCFCSKCSHFVQKSTVFHRSSREKRAKTKDDFHCPRRAIYSARKRKLYPTKKPAGCLIHGLFLYANSWCLHRSCNTSVLEKSIFAQQVGEGFEFGIPFFAETADEGLA